MATKLTDVGKFWAQMVFAARQEWHFLASSPWDRAQLSWFPLLAFVLFAAMFYSSVPRQLPIAVVDASHSPMSREIIRNLDAAPALSVVAQPTSLHEAWPLVRSMQAHAVLYIPPELEASVAQGQSATLFAFYNATFTTAGGSAYRDMAAAINDASSYIALTQVAAVQGLQVLKPAPVSAQVNVLYNPGKNFEMFLLGILLPGVLLLMLCAAVTSAFGRELRDRTIGQWLAHNQGQLLAAILGKALPYVALHWLYGVAVLIWVAYVRGDGIQGSAVLLIAGTLLLYSAYAAIGFMLAAVMKNMADAFSVVGLYVGTAVAFSGSTFPIDGAPLFARIWHQLVPLSAYLKLDAAERYMDAHGWISALYLLALLLFTLIPAAIGYVAYRAKAHNPESWGQR